MKTLSKSSIFAALVALFLSISLSGCFEEGTKTASQGGGVQKNQILIPKFSDERIVGLFLSGPSIANDPEVDAFVRDNFASIGSSLRKESYDPNMLTAYIKTKGGVSIVFTDAILKKVHKYSASIDSPSYKEIAKWESGMEKPMVL